MAVDCSSDLEAVATPVIRMLLFALGPRDVDQPGELVAFRLSRGLRGFELEFLRDVSVIMMSVSIVSVRLETLMM